MSRSGAETEPEDFAASPPLAEAGSPRVRKILPHIVVLFALIFMVMVGMAPMFVRMEELSICRVYYYKHDPALVDADGNVEETLCKVDEVQAELAFISGWLWFFETVPGE